VLRVLVLRRIISSTAEDIGLVGDCIGVISPSCCSSPRVSNLVRAVSTLALTLCDGTHLLAVGGPPVGDANIPLF
jgi:hypothetical protein